MASGGQPEAFGRAAELAAIETLIADARAGSGGALVLVGAPGSGKSTLLAHARAASSDAAVLGVAGVESESPLAFAALHRLLRPLRPLIDGLPVRQAQALRAALGEADLREGTDRFVVYLAVLTLLSEAAGDQGLVVTVDDLQWVDDASREALLFVARRADGERLAIAFACRDDAGVDVAGLRALVIDGLDEEAAAALLRGGVGEDVPAPVVATLHRRTEGNPLALVELARTLDRDVLLGRAPVPDQLPLTAGIEAAFLDRFWAVDRAARTVLLVTAADDSGDLDAIATAAAALGATDDAVAVAEGTGLVARRGDRMELRHPLVRSAIYGAASVGDRRVAHRALAEALHGMRHADRRAWHLAAAAEGPDGAVVAELDALAERAASAGGYEAASAAWERGAELTSDQAGRGRRLLEGARSAWTGGQPERAAALAEAALLAIEDPATRADAQLLRARVEWNTGSVASAHHRLLTQASVVAGTDPQRARVLAMFAASLEATSHVEQVEDPRDFAGEPASAEERCAADLLRAFVHIGRAQWREATAAVHAADTDAKGLALGLDGLLPNLALAAMHVALDESAVRLHDRLLATARDQGALIMVLYGLTRRGAVQLVRGRWDDVVADAHEAEALAEATGRPGLAAMPRAWLALVASLRGEPDAAERVAAVEEMVSAGSLGATAASVQDQLHWSRALLADSPADALHHYAQMTHGFAERMVALDRIELAVRAGRTDLAAPWLAAMERFAEGTGSPWAGAVVAHGRALLAAGDDAEAHLREALALHARSDRRVDAARTELAYGEWLRRSRRRVEARPHLRAALQVFEDVRARPLADRAAEELRATGERARRRDAAEPAGLTPTEETVARLVAQGLATRDVAARLFVSPRTVDFHLRNVFVKLGITSRAELAHVDLG